MLNKMATANNLLNCNKTWLSIILLLIGMSPALAKNWQIMLMPESDNFVERKDQVQDIELTSLHVFQREIELGLQSGLTKNLGTIVENARVFNNCQRKWCGSSSLAEAVSEVRRKAPNIQLLILYSIGTESPKRLSIQAIDPISFNILSVQELALIDQVSANSAFSLATDLSLLLAKSLEDTALTKEYLLRLNGFEFGELAAISTHLLSNTENTDLILNTSKQSYTVLNKYFPTINSEYTLVSILVSSQLETIIRDYFEQRKIEVNIAFEFSDNRLPSFIINRKSSPYIPSIFSSSVLLLMLILSGLWIIRRRYLHLNLEEFAHQRDADAWLANYNKAKFPLYMLKSKWSSHELYWQRAQIEAKELAAQAKVYFDAGDTNTAKLFVSKSLYKNKSNQAANKLVKSIEKIEKNSQQLSENEQWIRNKIAKAMNNYKQKHVLKALKQLYQALAFAKKEKALKKQYKAINKLIKKVNLEFFEKHSAVVVNCSDDATSHILLSDETIHLGRMPSKADSTWISSQDSVFYINHKSVSRIGQHCYIQFQNDRFIIVDRFSKNGTYINLQKLDAQAAFSLCDQDKMLLGGNSSITAVSMIIHLSNNQRNLSLRYDTNAISLLDRQELNKIWPDNALALSTQLHCTQQTLILAVNSNSHQVELIDVDEFENAQKHKNYMAVCEIALGEQASISPLNGLDNKQKTFIDDVVLLGKVPLILPCRVQYQNLEFQLSIYDGNSVPLAKHSLIENHVLSTS